MEENGLAAWGRWLKWRLWDSWHGTSVSAFDERRTSQDEAPGLNLGFVRVTWALLVKGLLALVSVVILVLVGFLLMQIDWHKVSPQVLNWLVIFVPTILVFALGFISGCAATWAVMSRGGKNG